MIEKRASIVERERFLRLLPKQLDSRDSMSLMSLMNDNWAPVFHENVDEDDPVVKARQSSLALDVWDHANAAIINALDARDGMLSLQLIDIISYIVKYSGRALSKLRKSPKFVPWLVYLLTPGAPFVEAVPIQFAVFKIIGLVIIGSSKSFLGQLMGAKIPTNMFLKLRGCCPSLISPLCSALEDFTYAAHQHCVNNQDDVRAVLEVGNRIACQRILEVDMTQQRLQNYMQQVSYTDIGEVVGPLACLVISLSLSYRIQTPMDVRDHLGIFGAGYTAQEPTDPVERARWSNRHFCLRAKQVDFSSDAGQAEGSQIMMTFQVKSSMVEEERRTDLRCAKCRKLETAADNNDLQQEQEEAVVLSKCSRCRRIYYCSRDCQTSHWKAHHKRTCRKPDTSTLPERLLNLNESVEQAHEKATSGGSTFYPIMFVVWLEWKYCSSNTGTN